MSNGQHVLNGIRIAITAFVVALLVIVTLGWMWTGSHQPPPLRTASHLVLAISALSGVYALAKIWGSGPRSASTNRS